MATAEGLLRVARSQLGIRETGGGWTKYGAAYETRKHAQGFDSAAWCDMFVGWCAAQAGVLKVVGDFAYTPYHADWFRDAGRWGQKPRVGAIVFFDWAGSHNIGAIDHVGIVEAVRADGSVVTIEGNTSNAVMRRVRRSGIAGYGYPKYPATATPRPRPTPRPPASSAKPAGKAPAWPGRLITQPPVMHSSAVKTWQTQMRRRGWSIAVDGAYGPDSEAVCRRFQSDKRLRVDGVVGPRTWAAAWTAPIT